MKIFLATLAVIALICTILVAPLFFPPDAADQRAVPVITGLPWQLEVKPNGNLHVLNLEIGTDTLVDVKNRYGMGDLAVVAAPEEAGTLEFFLDNVFLSGAITGKLVAAANLPADTIAAMRQRAAKTEYMQSATKKFTLTAQDVPTAWNAPIYTLTFVPSANLTEETIVKLFGQPAERIRAGEDGEYLLYPERGLGITLAARGKDVLQYIAPRDFAQLKKSFQASAAAQAAQSGGQ